MSTTAANRRDGVRARSCASASASGGVLEHAGVPTLRFAVEIGTVGAARRSGRWRSTSRCGSPRAGAATPRRAGAAASTCSASRSEWGRNLQTLHWTRTDAGRARVHRARPRSSCRSPAPTTSRWPPRKYFAALRGRRGAARVPLQRHGVLRGRRRAAAGGRIGWDKEADYRLPVRVWREMIDRYFPDSAWLRLSARRFDRLVAYKARHTLLTWEQTRRQAARRSRELVTRSPDRRRGALRGLHALAVPALGDQEPPALDLRRRVPASATARRARDDRWQMQSAVLVDGERRARRRDRALPARRASAS